MVLVLINWMYVFLTMYILGKFTLKRIYKLFNYDRRVTVTTSVVTGIVITTTYAGYFSLFYKVGLIANIIMLAVCAAFVFIDKADFLEDIYRLKSIKPWKACVFIILVFAVAFFTMEGELFWDTGLYHCQTIRWIEEYGVVKGLGHIVKRLAYNSTYFCQCALYSFKDVCGQSLHTLSGFYTLLMMCYAVFGFDKRENLSENEQAQMAWRGLSVLRLFPFVYFIIICSEIVSPASDFPLVNLIIFVTLRWFHNLANREKSETPYALLCVLIAFIVSVKLSVGVLVILVLAPAFWLIKGKKVKDIVLYLILGIVVSAPYFIRSVIISGWIIYPFTGVDLFNVDWKMTKEYVDADAIEMMLWGRGTEGAGNPDDSIFVWFKSWWDYIYTPQQQVITAAAISILSASVLFAYRIIRILIDMVKDKVVFAKAATKYGLEYSYFELVIIACLAFWLFKSPGIRYGFGYLLTMVFIVACDLLAHINKKMVSWVNGILLAACLVYLLPSLKAYLVWNYECIRYSMKFENFVKQEDYPIVEYGETLIDGKLKVYYPKEEMTQIWYDMFPGVWHSDVSGIEMRGDSIKDGFREKKRQ